MAQQPEDVRAATDAESRPAQDEPKPDDADDVPDKQIQRWKGEGGALDARD